MSSSRLELAFGSLVALVALPGCPISDDYFIDPRMGPADATGGTPALGGSGGSGGAGAPAGMGGLAGTGGSGVAGGGGSGETGGGPQCEEPCNVPRTCTSGCQDGWITISTPPGGFSPREKAAYTSTGTQLFIWGGVNESGTALNSGALYDPRTDTWKVVTNENTPSPRSLATAVWTGSSIVVWGGLDPGTMQALDDGAIYDTVEDAWLPLPPGPRARVAAVGAWVDERVVFFGGQDGSSNPLGGLDFYDPAQDAWQPGMLGSPAPVADPAVAGGTLTLWTYGGRTQMNTGVSGSTYYSMSSERWVASNPRTPGRWGSFATFAGAFFVWGGRNLNDLFDDGASFSPGGISNWESMSSFGAPSARFASDRESGWAFPMDGDSSNPRIVVIAGLDAPDSYLRDGGVYDVVRDGWEAIPDWPTEATHAFGAAGVVAGELVVWGGRDMTTLTNQGVRYRPPD